MKKIVSILLTILVFAGCINTVNAENVPVTEVIRVFNPGADITVYLNGDPGGQVSVFVLKPGTELPDFITDYDEFNKNVVYVSSLNLDSAGKEIFRYYAEEEGIYTVYVRGADIDYSATNNDAPLINPDKIYVEAWSNTIYKHPDLKSWVMVSKANIDKFGAKAVAKNVMEQLKNVPAGRRSIYINNDLMPKTLCGERIWWDEGVVKTKAILGEFFRELRDAGGMIDFINSDTEQTFSMYALTGLANSGNAEKIAQFHEIIGALSSDPRYPAFEERLIARGYDTSADGNRPLSSICNYGNKNKNYLRFNAVCGEYASKYLEDAVYQTAREYFANVKCTDYGTGDGKLWMGGYEGTTHPNYISGNSYGMGTHASPILYSKQVINHAYQEIIGAPGQEGAVERKVTVGYTGMSNDFKELLGFVSKLRTSALVNEDRIMPWIATEPIQSDSFDDIRYRNESIMHVALHNPDRLLYFNANSDANELSNQAKDLMTILDEVNGMVAYEDRRSINTDRTNVEIPIVMSGIYANGRNLWRITPDTAIVSSDAFLVSAKGEGPVFSAGGVTVTFPEGEIIEVGNTMSDIGYWIETPKGVTPITEYADELKVFDEKAIITFYNDVGYMTDPANGEPVDVVASYQGMYDGKMNFIAAKYDEKGMLLDAESKECGVFNPNGNVFFLGVDKPADVANMKFFLWKSGSLEPVADGNL